MQTARGSDATRAVGRVFAMNAQRDGLPGGASMAPMTRFSAAVRRETQTHSEELSAAVRNMGLRGAVDTGVSLR